METEPLVGKKFDDYGTDGTQSGGLDPEPTVGMVTMTLNLVTVSLGTGVLAQPWGLAGASLLPGLVIIAFVLALNAATCVLLTAAAERYNQFDLGSLMRRLPKPFGVWVSGMTEVFIFLSCVGALIGYFIVINDSLQPFLPTSGLWSHRPVIVLLSGLFLLPLCVIDQKYLSFTSTLSVIMNANILAVALYVLHDQGVYPAPSLCWLGLTKGTVTYFSALMFSVVIQMCVLPMYEKLEDRTPKRFGVAIGVSFSIVFLIFAAFSVLGYLAYGPSVPSNLLVSFPHNTWGNLTRAGMVVVIASVFPLLILPMVVPLVKSLTRKHFLGFKTDTIFAAILTFIIAFLACFIRDLGFTNVLTGAISVVSFVGIVPGLTGLYLVDNNGGFFWRLVMYSLILFSIVMSVLGLVYTDNYTADLAESCLLKVG